MSQGASLEIVVAGLCRRGELPIAKLAVLEHLANNCRLCLLCFVIYLLL